MPIHESYPLRTVARLTGLSPDLIRAWEKRYGVVAPVRGPRGARLYSADDLHRLRLLARAVAAGRTIGDVAWMTNVELAAVVEAVGPAPAAFVGDRAALIDRALEAVKKLDAAALDRHLSDALMALGSARFVRQVVSPLLVRAGDRWSTGDLSVAEEHFVSGAMRNLLSGLLRARGAVGSRPTLLLATPSGERHEFGLLITSLLIADAGLGLCYLGTDLPAGEIVDAARRSDPAVVGLGLTNTDNRAAAVAQVEHVESALPIACELWLGGREAAAVADSLAATHALVVDDIDKLEREISRLRAARAGGV